MLVCPFLYLSNINNRIGMIDVESNLDNCPSLSRVSFGKLISLFLIIFDDIREYNLARSINVSIYVSEFFSKSFSYNFNAEFFVIDEDDSFSNAS